MSEEIRFIDLFRGVGGFKLGLERANNVRSIQPEDSQGTNGIKNELDNGEHVDHRKFKGVWSNDVDKYASIIYKKHWPETPEVTSDIRGVDEKTIPKHDLICAGFPCQSFSVAGKRQGFKDTRGTLFFEICRIAEYHRPELLLLENVKGLLSHDGGRTFATILYALEDLGYWWEYQVLNSKNYGVPQNRERVFIVGHIREGCTRPIFPFTKISGISDKKDKGEQRSGSGIRGGISPTIDARYGALRNSGEPYIVADRSRYLNNKGRNLESPKPYANSITAVPKDNLLALRHVRTDRGKQARRDIQKGGIDNTPFGDEFRAFVPSNEPVTGTVTTGINKDALIGHNTRIRRLTPVECERLQGFPDGWTEGISDTQRYKCLGNAVTVNVIEFLGHRLRASINSKSLRKDGLGR